ncbi:MAG TPA: putative sulfate exporter family transporter [Cyclobacteriaceae bacterium]|nr:putative sulfate exporter family transporter [Cyclobacteriaceae bacterium]
MYSTKKIATVAVFFALIAFCFTPFFNPPVALLSGILFSIMLTHPFPVIGRKAITILLQLSIIGLGFGINLFDAAKVGMDGLWLTILSISVTIVAGLAAGKWLGLQKNITLLISMGTAICGGSAIAALSPILEAKEEDMSISLGTIFILNAVALFIFPLIGHWINLDQHQFGIWSAIAIHDTSSVVGAAQTYGNEALQVATTVKLSRALWIVPIALITAIVFKKNKSIKFPYFILLFVIAMVASTFVSQIQSIGEWIVPISKKGMTVTLFLIGAGLNFSSVKKVGVKPLLLGIGLWILIAAGSLAFILSPFF